MHRLTYYTSPPQPLPIHVTTLNLPRSCSTHGDIFCNRNKPHYFPRYACNVNNGERAGICSADTEIAFYTDGDVVSVNINGKLAFIVAAIPRREFVQSDVRIGIWKGKRNNNVGILLDNCCSSLFSKYTFLLLLSCLGQESMKGVGLNPSYSSYSQGNPSQRYF